MYRGNMYHQGVIDQLKTSYGLDDDIELLRYCVEYKDDVPQFKKRLNLH